VRRLLAVAVAADLNRDTLDSGPSWTVSLGETAIYFAREPGKTTGGLWRTDGTPGGTQKFFGGLPGSYNGLSDNYVAAEAGGRVYFRATHPGFPGPDELWTTDGTAEGTRMLKAIRPGGPLYSGSDGEFAAYGGRVFFNATEGNGTELWVTDGTPQGTSLFFDALPGSASSQVQELTVSGNYLFFFAASGLWRSDGTSGGTIQLLNGLTPSIEGMDRRAYFFAPPPGKSSPSLLWSSDGTVAGTTPLMNPDQPPPFVGANHLTRAEDKLFFTASAPGRWDVLWVTDASASAVTRLESDAGGYGSPYGLKAMGSIVLFRAGEGTLQRYWRSDGTRVGTYRLSNVSAALSRFVVSPEGNRAFVEAGDTAGIELWVTDGTPQGTRMVQDLNPGSLHGMQIGLGTWIAILNDGRAVFPGKDLAHGLEPRVTNASPDGTVLLADINNVQTASGYPYALMDVGGTLFLGGVPRQSSGGTQYGLFRHDAAAGQAHVISPMSPPQFDYQPSGRGQVEYAAFKGELFYFAEGAARRLHRSNGTPVGTVPFMEFYRRGGTGEYPDAGTFAVLGDRLYFAAANNPDSRAPVGLWRTDGTAQGTELVAQSSGRPPIDLTVIGNQLYFGMGGELLRIDNSRTSPVVVATFDGLVHNIVSAGGKVFYARSFPTGGSEMGVIDPATGEPRPLSGTFGPLVPFKGRIYFSTLSDLMYTDGTPEGTVALQSNGQSLPAITTMHALGDFLYFVASTPAYGSEWWRRDGTAGGTRLLADIEPGPGGSEPPGWIGQSHLARSIALWRGQIFFTAKSKARGAELWRIDPAGNGPAVLVADLWPGAGDSDPAALTVVGDQLYFVATDPNIGRELFKVIDDFSSMPGDADRDGEIGFSDLVILAQNYGTPEAKTWETGDFTGDGEVDFEDLVILAQRYGTSGATPTNTTETSTAAARSAAVFSDRKVNRPQSAPVMTKRATPPKASASARLRRA
jgi:ELWxxDGT repeat protein